MMWSAPAARASSAFFSVDVVPITVAPCSLAIWQSSKPTPPATACATDADCGDPQFACNETIGQCVCLHNAWARITEDDSSRVTGSTVFDFNGDGAAEIVYNDECFFRIYDGLTGAVLFKHNSPSRTRIENAVVADVDNDGNAEIAFVSNNDASSCSQGNDHPNGLAVWGDASDTWVSQRRRSMGSLLVESRIAARSEHTSRSLLLIGRERR